MARVLILCTGNSARSQMAEGLLREKGKGRFEAESAGTKPGIVRPEAITVMDEVGIDLRSHRSKHVDEVAGQHFDVVITVCDYARDVCPIYPAETKTLHWSFEDPAALEGNEEVRLAAFRMIRDQLSKRFDDWLSQTSHLRSGQ